MHLKLKTDVCHHPSKQFPSLLPLFGATPSRQTTFSTGKDIFSTSPPLPWLVSADWSGRLFSLSFKLIPCNPGLSASRLGHRCGSFHYPVKWWLTWGRLSQGRTVEVVKGFLPGKTSKLHPSSGSTFYNRQSQCLLLLLQYLSSVRN